MKKSAFILVSTVLFFSQGCKEDSPPDVNCDYVSINANDEVIGYSILEKLPGIWDGPVTSSTGLGNFPTWIVDFRPNSPSFVSAKNELDRENDIFMSFFIAKHDCKNKVAFRNGGTFVGLERNSYMFCDSVYQDNNISFYRFSDPVDGGKRVNTTVTFKQDSLLIHAYSNKFGTLSEPVSHMYWKANLRDETSAQSAINHFGFPKKQLDKDMTHTFDNVSDAVFYSSAQDPFPEEDQPYLGKSNVNITISNPAVVDPSKKVLIVITTQALFNGFNFNVANLKYRSRYVILNAETTVDFTFNYMHPGQYYLNAIYDSNGDLNFSSGDFINGSFDVPFTLAAKGITTVNANINFEIP